jgi:GTPase
MFVDYAVIDVAGGVGGSGAEAWRREMGVPRGGPAGGNGGKGGSVILRADKQLTTLLDYRYQTRYAAERGEHGMGYNRTGRDGEDLVLRVPPGTVALDANSGEIIGELFEEGQEIVVARGGRGGRGNTVFATPTNRAPRKWEPGEEGEERRITLELKLIADVGLVGQPNAGKSTLLAAISAATPKIADYPFTTLQPNLGVVPLSGSRTFVMADIPGIIEGAHEGKGLGLRFLRHIERTRTLAVMIPVDSEDAQAEYELLLAELCAHSEELATKPHCVVITKTDMLAPDEEPPRINAPNAWGQFALSAVAHQNLTEFLEAVWARVQAEKDIPPEEPAAPVYRP